MSKAKKSACDCTCACLAEVSETFAKYAAQTPAGKDYIVRDFSLAEMAVTAGSGGAPGLSHWKSGLRG